jgi:DNA end-binding protein Ku
MASTVWKGQLTFGLVSFPVRLLRAARKERIALKYVREVRPGTVDETEESVEKERVGGFASTSQLEIAPVRQGYFSGGSDPVPQGEIQRGYALAPDKFAVIPAEELRKLRRTTSADMQILRSVRMHEIDPVFLETSYYAVPGPGGEGSYSLFYRALSETQYAALAQVAMHGREHIMVIRAGPKGLIAHTMFYVNEVHAAEEYATNVTGVAGKELDLAKRLVEAIAEPFRPEEFTDRYRDQLEALIASKDAVQSNGAAEGPKNSGKVIDMMDALRRSLEAAKTSPSRKPAVSQAPERKHRKREA